MRAFGGIVDLFKLLSFFVFVGAFNENIGGGGGAFGFVITEIVIGGGGGAFVEQNMIDSFYYITEFPPDIFDSKSFLVSSYFFFLNSFSYLSCSDSFG